MAWASTEEQAMYLVRQHMGVMSLEKKKALIELYSQLFFPQQENGWSNVRWTTRYGVTFVTMWDEEHLYNNLRLAMIKEIMGLGPMKYCIVNNAMSNFESKLILLIHFLPQKKMCFFPPKDVLGGPFSHSPWLEIGEAIRSRRLSLKNPFLRTIFYTQQFVIFMRTGFYGPSYWI